MPPNEPKIAILSGGTATNELVPIFSSISGKLSYILPILDNGGSTSELIRVIGGPAIGDIRSRLTRLIPSSQEHLRKLLSYRLPNDPEQAKREWNHMVEGTHELWENIDPSTREIFRSFLMHVHVELLKRSKHFFPLNTTKLFRFELANVGNLFLTGVRLFIGSLDSAIVLFTRLTGIDPNIEVLPCINTNFSYHISALLQNGLVITGQSQISHPSEPDPIVNHEHLNVQHTRPSTPAEHCDMGYFDMIPKVTITGSCQPEQYLKNSLSDQASLISSDEEETGNTPLYIHPALRKSQLHFNKSDHIQPLLSPIERIFYISPYGEEILPSAYNKVVTSINNSDAIVYSIGSLMTSIIPIVILKGVAKAIANDVTNDNAPSKKKIFLLNGCNDRETFGMQAVDFIRVIFEMATHSLNEVRRSLSNTSDTSLPTFEWISFVTHLFYIENGSIPVDREYLEEKKGIQCVAISLDSPNRYDLDDLKSKLHNLINDIN